MTTAQFDAAQDAAGHGQRQGRDKLAMQVAWKIRESIVASGWPIGDSLGSEAELLERYGVSRAVLRESLRILEHQGIAFMMRGRSGGLRVQAPDPAAATFAVAMFLRSAGTDVEDLLTVRVEFEAFAASLAAGRIAEGDITKLRESVEVGYRSDRSPDDGPPASLFHLTVAELSGNPAVELFIGVLSQLTYIYLGADHPSAGPQGASPAGGAVVGKASDDHRWISDAIVAGNAAQAKVRMLDHITEMAYVVREEGAAASPQPSTPTFGEGPKRASQIAHSIMTDIWCGLYDVGDVVAGEEEAASRYHASRAVMREAVRLLEHYGIARMRRGRGGGLIVTRPDVTASVEAMAICLEYRDIDSSALQAVLEMVQLATVARVALRAHLPEVDRELLASRERELSVPLSESWARGGDLHSTLATLSGSTILDLFYRVVKTLFDRYRVLEHWDSQQATSRHATDAHLAVIDALRSGDGPLAEHRMQRHLEAARQMRSGIRPTTA